MKRTLLASLSIAALASAPFLAAVAEGPTPTPSQHPNPLATVQPCTAVNVETLDSIDSAHAKPGDFFRFRTLSATTDGGKQVVIPAHTLGYGVVSVAVPAGKQGRSGSLLLEPLYLKMPDGDELGVVLDHGSRDLQKQGKTGDMIPGYLGAIPVPGLGVVIGAINYFSHGKDITLPKGTPFSIFPENDPQSAFCQPD